MVKRINLKYSCRASQMTSFLVNGGRVSPEDLHVISAESLSKQIEIFGRMSPALGWGGGMEATAYRPHHIYTLCLKKRSHL